MIKTLIVSFLGVSSVRAAQASHTRLCQLGASRTGFYPSLNLRSSFAEPSLEQKIYKGCTMGFISYLCG